MLLLVCYSSISDEAAEVLTNDPSTYEFYDCTRLGTERISLTAQIDTMRSYIAEAETGFAGSIVGEAVYQPDLVKLRGSLRRVNDVREP